MPGTWLEPSCFKPGTWLEPRCKNTIYCFAVDARLTLKSLQAEIAFCVCERVLAEFGAFEGCRVLTA